MTEPVNIGSGCGTPILDLARQVIRVTGSRSEVEIVPPREQEVVGYTADISRMRRLLDIHPGDDPLEFLPLVANALPSVVK
jgi:nucleoside-diphosphate-sugar epimerase